MLVEFEPLNDSQSPEPNEDYRARSNVPEAADAMVDAPSSPSGERSLGREGPRFSARRWLLIALGLTLIGMIGAFASVALRRTRLDRTRRFWGPEVVRSLQLSDEFRLKIPAEGPLQWKTEAVDGSVDLSATPGIAHLRHALLDERHYRWETVRDESVESVIAQIPNAERVSIQLRGTPAEMRNEPPIEAVELKLELSHGWVGVAGGSQAVRMRERVRSAVRHNLLTFSNVTSKRADVK